MASEKGATTDVFVSAPIDSDSAGKGGSVAAQSVVRIICPRKDSAGSGFLHKSGKIVTAHHVVANCSEILVAPASGAPVKATVTASDEELDLTLLAPVSALTAPSLPISTRTNFSIGTQVSTWGYPGGYSGAVPLLSVGYLAGLEAGKAPSGRVIRRWVVNAAFNRGNSGGPLVLIETGEVIGVVSSKLAPISPTAKSALDALEKQQSGFTYGATRPDGSKFTMSEGQVIGLVLNELRNQVQLVIGKAVLVDDVRNFLKAQGVEP
jgi:S1-C subfamily serine protease